MKGGQIPPIGEERTASPAGLVPQWRYLVPVQPLPEVDDAEAHTFLCHWDPSRRGLVGNLFTRMVQTGLTRPEDVLEMVVQRCRLVKHVDDWSRTESELHSEVLTAITGEHRTAAVRFAAWSIAHQMKTAAERRRDNRTRKSLKGDYNRTLRNGY